MNSYGDPQSARARAQVPGRGRGSAPDDAQASARYPDEPPCGARRRTVGGAPARPVGRCHRQRVRGGTGAPRRARRGRRARPVGTARRWPASVGARRCPGSRLGSAAGRRSRARGRAPGPGGPGMPPGTGDDGAIGAGGGRAAGAGKDKSKAAKRRRRTNILTAAAAVVVILLGAGVVGGTYFFDSVELPPPVTEDQSNVILDGNGNVLAKIGDQNRTVVPETKINLGRRARGGGGRGQELLHAPRHRHEGHRPRRVEQLHRRRDAGRLDDHPAVRAARRQPQGDQHQPQAARGGDRPQARVAVQQARRSWACT